MQRKPRRQTRLRVAAITTILLAAVLGSIAIPQLRSADEPYPWTPAPDFSGDSDYALALATVQFERPGPQINYGVSL
jgi:hypothetical protein